MFFRFDGFHLIKDEIMIVIGIVLLCIAFVYTAIKWYESKENKDNEIEFD
tara:strand:- start:694 stop:843 length:150 start_codon:yes stop_codon:yes gene_type:complete